MKVKIKLIEDGKAPYKKHEDDACYDLFAREINYITNDFVEVKLGVAIEPPSSFRIALYPRSNISTTGWMLANGIGVGDQSFRGEYKAYFNRVRDRDPNLTPFPYKIGNRVIQFEVVRQFSPIIEIVDELTDSDRGSGGFGSTGLQ